MMPGANDLEDFLGEEVVDFEGNPVGSFACYWEGGEKKALLLGVDVPDRSGQTHLVPARGARFNERQGYVQVPFLREKIVEAPCLECGCEMDEAIQRRIQAFYELPMLFDPAGTEGEAQRQELRRISRRVAPSGIDCPADAPASCASQEAGAEKFIAEQ